MASPEFYNSYEAIWQQLDGAVVTYPTSFFETLRSLQDAEMEKVQSLLSIGPGKSIYCKKNTSSLRSN